MLLWEIQGAKYTGSAAVLPRLWTCLISCLTEEWARLRNMDMQTRITIRIVNQMIAKACGALRRLPGLLPFSEVVASCIIFDRQLVWLTASSSPVSIFCLYYGKQVTWRCNYFSLSVLDRVDPETYCRTSGQKVHFGTSGTPFSKCCTKQTDTMRCTI